MQFTILPTYYYVGKFQTKKNCYNIGRHERKDFLGALAVVKSSCLRKISSSCRRFFRIIIGCGQHRIISNSAT